MTVTSYKDHLPFLAYMLSSMLVFAGVDAMLSLISSVNIEHGLGTISLAISYGTAILPAFMIPGFLRKVGVKRMLIFCGCCYLIFVLGNIYATPASLIIAGIFNGIAESVGWTTSSLVNSYFARVRSYKGTKDESVYTKHYFGYYWTASPIGSMLGNLIVFTILHFDRKTSSTTLTIPHNTTLTIPHNITSSTMTSLHCGAMDCQRADHVEASMSQYQPVNGITRTVVIGTCAFMILVAIVLNIAFIPSDVDQVLRTTRKSRRSTSSNDDVIMLNGDVKSSQAVTSSSYDLLMRNGGGGHVLRHNNRVADKNNFPQLSSTHVNNNQIQQSDNDGAQQSGQTTKLMIDVENNDDNGEKATTNDGASSEDDESGNSSVVDQHISLMQELAHQCKRTMKLLLQGKQLLVMLLPIYNGMEVGFIFGEMTRAYSACILGLDKVSVSIIIFAIANSFSSLLAGRMAGRYGRNLPFFLGYMVDIMLYVVMLTWTPRTDQEGHYIYLLFLGLGYSEGMWATLVNEMYGDIFIEQTDIAYNLWGLLLNIGMMIMYAISTLMCVYHKIYLMISLLTVAVTFYVLMLMIYYKDRKFIQRPFTSVSTTTTTLST